MHPVAEYREEVAALKAELAELKAKLAPVAPVAAPVDPRLAGLPAGAHFDACGLLRNGRGQVMPDANAPTTAEEAMAKAKVEREAKEAAELERQTAGLPEGMFRDPCGLIRIRATGKIAAVQEVEDRQRDAVERIRAADHRQWKVLNHLPVRPLPEGEEGEG